MANCPMNGNHTAEEYAAECPALGRTRVERIAAWRARQAAKENA